jgi:hypothetical protein
MTDPTRDVVGGGTGHPNLGEQRRKPGVVIAQCYVMNRLACAVAPMLLASCNLYFSHSDPATVDATPPDASVVCDGGSAGPFLRDPDNLQCSDFGRGGSCIQGPADQAPAPPWGVCGGPCDGENESTCVVDPQCRAAYDFDCYTGTTQCAAFTAFLGCFSLSTAGQPSSACEGLDSWGCSSRSDCVALHTQVCDQTTGQCWAQYVECRTEMR